MCYRPIVQQFAATTIHLQIVCIYSDFPRTLTIIPYENSAKKKSLI